MELPKLVPRLWITKMREQKKLPRSFNIGRGQPLGNSDGDDLLRGDGMARRGHPSRWDFYS